MRGKLLSNGPNALADYELLEMLLFLGIERVDTKPLAKSLINRFGTLAAVITASTERLKQAGLDKTTVATLHLVAQAASRLTLGENEARTQLRDWDSLIAYLDGSRRRTAAPGVSVLFLDGRNRLLADQSWPRPVETVVFSRELFRRGLELHATALILLSCGSGRGRTMSSEDSELAKRVRKDAQSLAIALHDCLVWDGGQWISFRKEGLL